MDSPNVKPPAPIIFIAIFLIGLAVRPWFPWTMPASTSIGLGLLALSIAIDSWGFLTMKRERTNILPHNPAHALVRSGPFRFSRNPLYIGMIFGYLSAVVWIGSLPSLLLLPLALLYLRYYVVAREERYLERRFGEEYRKYCREVRRWI